MIAKVIQSTLRAQWVPPSKHAFLGHSLRDFSRRFSTAPALTQDHLTRPVRSFPSFLRNWEDDMFPREMFQSFFPSMDALAPLYFMDDLRKKRHFPVYSIHEDEDHHNFHVTMDLPGVKMEDVNVQIEDDQLLSITGHRKKTDEKGNVSEMKFDRRFRLGNVMDSEHIVASLSDGVLNVVIPKLPEESSKEHIKKIEVINGSGEIEC